MNKQPELPHNEGGIMSNKIELPYNIDAEKGLLGTFLLDNSIISRFKGLLNREDFYLKAHKVIFTNLVELYDQDGHLDLVTLIDQLKKSEELEEAGKEEYVAKLLDNNISSALVPGYLKIVKDASFNRKVIERAEKLKGGAYRGELGISDIIEEIRKWERLALQMEFIGKEPEPLSVDKGIIALREAPEGKKIGYEKLDKYITLAPSELIIIGSRPRHGKSTFAYNILLNLCEQYPEEPFIFFSYEVNYDQIFARLLSILAAKCFHKSYSFWDIRRQYREQKGIEEEILRAQEKLKEYKNIYLVNEPSFTVSQIITYSKRVLDTQGSIGAILIDYMELIKTESKQETEELRVSHIATTLRQASQELNTPIIVLAQMNRETVKGQKRKKPTLEGLRYSGKQEAEATTVLGLYNPEVEKVEDQIEEEEKIVGAGTKEITPLQVILLKSRWGEPNKLVVLDYDMKTGFIDNFKESTW